MARRTASRVGRIGRSMAMGTAGLLLGGVAACGEPAGAGDAPGVRPAIPVTPGGPQTPVTRSPELPPPISGGTLLITRDDKTAAAADPDRDSVWLVDLPSQSLRRRVQLAAGSEPGRVIEDQDGKLHVALRHAGQIAKVDPQTGAVLSTRTACAAPRGMAYDDASDSLYVACAGGELVTMKARGGDAARTWFIDTDLRDVARKGSHLLISRFRSAELIEVDESGTIVGRTRPRDAKGELNRDPMGQPITSSPTTAWRLVPLPDGALMLHQRGQDGTVSTRMGGYGAGSCKGAGIVSSGLTAFTGASGSASIGGGMIASLTAMAVDVAVSRDGQSFAIVSTGESRSPTTLPVLQVTRTDLTPSDPCSFPRTTLTIPPGLQLTAGAFDSRGQLWLQSRQPARLVLAQSTQQIDLTGAEDRSDEGHRLFHTPTTGMVACASCHAEAGDDGHVWTFDVIGPRRTQSLRGGLLATAPFHWDGDMSDLNKLMNDVFVGRMSGQSLSPPQVAAVGSWLDGQPALPKSAPRDLQAVQRGKDLFNDATVACAGCHSGTHFTNNLSASVGTGKSFQVPSLVEIAARAPFMHTGCAPTLRARFDTSCGGGDSHGKTSNLSAGQVEDLVAYLETL